MNPNLPWDFFLKVPIATYLCFYPKSRARALVISSKTHWMIYISNFDPIYPSNRNEAWNNVGLLEFFNICSTFSFIPTIPTFSWINLPHNLIWIMRMYVSFYNFTISNYFQLIDPKIKCSVSRKLVDSSLIVKCHTTFFKT